VGAGAGVGLFYDVEGVPAHGKGVGARSSVRSLPTQIIL